MSANEEAIGSRNVLGVPKKRACELESVYKRHWEELCRYLNCRFGAGPPDPEDIAQQTFVNYAALDDISAVRHPRAFLFRTASNLVADYRRSAAFRRNVSAEGMDIDEILDEHEAITPEVALIDRCRYEYVLSVLNTLPRRQRRFLILNRFQGMNCTEIAKRSGVSVSTAYREVEAAVFACRAALTKLDGDE